MKNSYTVEYVKELMDGTFLVQINGIESIYTKEDLQNMEYDIIRQIEETLGL